MKKYATTAVVVPAAATTAAAANAAAAAAAPLYPTPSTDDLVDEFERLSLAIRKQVEAEAEKVPAYRKAQLRFRGTHKITVYYFTYAIGELDQLIADSDRAKLRIACHAPLTPEEWTSFGESHPQTAALTRLHARMIPSHVNPTELSRPDLRRYERYKDSATPVTLTVSDATSPQKAPVTPLKPRRPPAVPPSPMKPLPPTAAAAAAPLPRPTSFLSAPPTTAAAAMSSL